MSFDFNSLKSRSRSSVKDLASAVEKQNSGGYSKDERILELSRDDEGNGYKVVRLLPAAQVDMEAGLEEPWVRMWSHGFKGPGGWYIENSLTTIGQDDPVSEYNSNEWDDNDKAAQERVRNRARRLKYYSNVLVIRDKEKPENEGKVMLLGYGKKIHDKITAALKPKFEDEVAFNPFDMWEGADFVIKIWTETKGKAKFPNYDDSKFQPCAPLGTDEEIRAVWEKCHSLNDLVAPDKFKSYDELKKRFETVMKIGDQGGAAPRASAEAASDAAEAATPSMTPRVPSSAPAQDAASPAPAAQQQAPAASTPDDDLAFFQDLGQN